MHELRVLFAADGAVPPLRRRRDRLLPAGGEAAALVAACRAIERTSDGARPRARAGAAAAAAAPAAASAGPTAAAVWATAPTTAATGRPVLLLRVQQLIAAPEADADGNGAGALADAVVDALDAIADARRAGGSPSSSTCAASRSRRYAASAARSSPCAHPPQRAGAIRGPPAAGDALGRRRRVRLFDSRSARRSWSTPTPPPASATLRGRRPPSRVPRRRRRRAGSAPARRRGRRQPWPTAPSAAPCRGRGRPPAAGGLLAAGGAARGGPSPCRAGSGASAVLGTVELMLIREPTWRTRENRHTTLSGSE